MAGLKSFRHLLLSSRAISEGSRFNRGCRVTSFLTMTLGGACTWAEVYDSAIEFIPDLVSALIIFQNDIPVFS